MKKVSHTNDEDFKRAERNFKGIDETLEHMHERMEKIEAGSIVAFLRATALGVSMMLDGEIPLTHLQDPQIEYKHLPDSVIDFTAELYDVPKKLIMKSIGREVTG